MNYRSRHLFFLILFCIIFTKFNVMEIIGDYVKIHRITFLHLVEISD